MDAPHDTDILSKLGILQSTLECPKKARNVSRKKSKNKDINAAIFSLDESSDDCLFENKSFSRKSLLTKKSHCEAANQHNLFFLFGLCSIFFLIGFSSVIKEFYFFKFLKNLTSNENIITLLRFATIYGFFYLSGLIFAGSIFTRINSFALFFFFMLVSIPLTISLSWQDSFSSFRFIAAFQAFLLGTIERGGLLIVFSLKCRHRLFFSIYAALSLGSLFACLITSVSNLDILFQSNFVDIKATNFKFVLQNPVKREIIFENSTFSNNTNSKENLYTLPIKVATKNILKNFFLPYNNTASITEMSNSLKQPIVFKTKTEENEIKRKEAETRRKELEKQRNKIVNTISKAYSSTIQTNEQIKNNLLVLSNEKDLNTKKSSKKTFLTPQILNISTTQISRTLVSIITSADTTIKTFLPISNSKNLENITTIPNYIIKIKNHFLPTHFLPIIIGIVLVLLLIPSFFYGCFCCKKNYSLAASPQILSLSRQNNNSYGHPIISLIMPNVIWLIHSMFHVLLLVYLPLYSDLRLLQKISQTTPLQKQLSFLVPLIIRFMSPISRIFFVFKPSLVSNPKVINISYLIAILVCLFVYSGLYFSWEKSLIFELIIMGFLNSVLPLLLYSWKSVILGGINPFNISFQFLLCECLGQIFGLTTFSWLIGLNNSNLSKLFNKNMQVISLKTFHQTALTLLITSYFLFIWLWTSVFKAERQMQIIQLSVAVNGKSRETSEKTKKIRTLKKGKYKALLEDKSEAESSSSDFALDFPLTETNNSSQSDMEYFV